MSRFREMGKSSNPFMSEKILDKSFATSGDVMTVNGAVNKTFILFGLMLLTASYSFLAPSKVLMIVGMIGGLIAVVYASFKPQHSGVAAPIYALFEGLFVGTVTAIYGAMFDGIIFQAVTLTIGILFMMLFLYKAKIIVVTEKLRSGIMMATGAVFLVYMASWIMSFFGMSMPLLHSNGLMGIGISLVIIAIASFNFLLDFDFIEKSAERNAPKYMEWYGAIGLMVTLIWLYLEILRLLSKLSRD